MDVHTSSSSAVRRPNPRAGWSVVCGLLSVAAVPAGVALARQTAGGHARQLGRLDRGRGAPRLQRDRPRPARAASALQITLGRAGGRAGGPGRQGCSGILGVLVGLTAGLALGFYGLLALFAG